MSNYVPGPNSHIDTSDFENRLEDLSERESGYSLDDMEFEKKAYEEAFNIIRQVPASVSDETIICRYLTTEKFLWFLGSKNIYMGRVDGFDDPLDCAIPEDYATAISAFYARKKCSIDRWVDYSDNMRHQWLISCWTEISSNYDDCLLWYRYAGGPTGVGITVPYGALREVFFREIEKNNTDYKTYFNINSGYVDYGNSLKILPFNKRAMFKNEKEIRFVAESEYYGILQIPIADIFNKFGLRFSPDVPDHHKNVLQDIWIKFGGNDDFVVA